MPQRSHPNSRSLEQFLFCNPYRYRLRDVGKDAVHNEIHGGKDENRCVPYTGHDSSAESKRRRSVCSRSSPGTMEPHQNNKESLSSSRNATLDIFKRSHGIDNSPPRSE